MDIVLIIVVSIVLLFIILQFMMIRKSKSQKGKRIDNVDGVIGEAISKHQSLLIYFWGPGCAACRPQTKIIDELKRSYDNILSFDISKDLNSGRKLGIMATPTILVIKDKVIEEVLIGVQKKERLIKYLLD
ncbi:MAG: thioredoxin family protein [Bacteroidota bacterium]|nr:thioredoxin family protein [Bacteroidota bacterium]